MKPSEFFRYVQFHDSGLIEMSYEPDMGLCILRVSLLNYEQPWYKPGDSQAIEGSVVITGIRSLRLEPPAGLIPEEGPIGAEILGVGPHLTTDTINEDCWYIGIEIRGDNDFPSEFFTLNFCAEDIIWVPD